MSQRKLKWILPFILLTALGSQAVAAGDRRVPLFIIERTKNANVVHYDAQLTSDGSLNAKEPVVAYWIMLAEDGRREDLNWVERSKAYGLETKADGTGCYRVTLTAYHEREIKVCRDGEGARAVLVIDGHPAIFDKLFINSTEGLIKPTIHYLELFGRDVESGEKRYEKILPK